MTTPIKQRTGFNSANNTPHGSSRKIKSTTNVTNHLIAEHMTPSRMNRIYPPKPQETVDNNKDDGEGIQVAIRMRPLNSKEHTHKKVWKVLSKYASVAQTTLEGKPLPERIAGRNFFTYDQTFDESSTTYQVYSAIAQPIVTTACTGRNGTIFAYGQTSSGKTYTMQGSGTIAEGSSENIQNGNGGIVHMAAHDIFSYIASCQDRVFVVRASFLEIYNEEVRDLLQDYSNSSKVLQIREDPRRGVFVQSKELIAIDSASLLAVLWQGEKSRSFATTAMNERSSRSHTILRITIESRSRIEDNDENENDDTGGAIRVSTLNLVDLAGSESVRHTGATGDRQKEGGMINQSLLTLSRVIVALGTPNSSHVNFRDSKLTRILQPSLSGNARMAVVCCATPSELYLEETRSTLLFASRAKLVKTNAQINEVLDDRSIIRRLQRELALARNQQHSGGNGVQITADVLEWENIATSAGKDAKLAKDKLKRLYTTILMNNTLDDTNVSMILGVGEQGTCDAKLSSETILEIQDVEQPPKKRHCRRMSDGNLHQFLSTKVPSTPSQDLKQSHPSTDPPNFRKHISEIPIVSAMSMSDELYMMRYAVAAKEAKAVRVKRQMDHVLKQLQSKDLDLVAANCSNDLLRSDRDEKSTLCIQMTSVIDELKSALETTKAACDDLIVEKENELKTLQSERKIQLEDRRVLEETLDLLQDSKVEMEKDLKLALTEKDVTISALQAELESYRQQLSHQVDVVNVELQQQLVESDSEKQTLMSTLEATSLSLVLVTNAKDEVIKENEELREEIKSNTGQYNAVTSDLDKVNSSLHDANHTIEQYQIKISSLEFDTIQFKNTTTALLTENAALKEEMLQLSGANKVLEAAMESVRQEKESFRLEGSNLSNLLQVAEVKIEGLLIVLQQNETEIEQIYTQLASFSTLKNDSENMQLHQKSIVADLESQLFTAVTERNNAFLQSKETQESLIAVNLRYDELSQILLKSKDENILLRQANSELTGLHAEVESRLVTMTQKYDMQLADHHHALADAVQAESIEKENRACLLIEVNNRLDALSIILYRSELDKNYLTDESTHLKELNVRMAATIDLLNERITSDGKAFNDRLCELLCYQDETKKFLRTKESMVADGEKKVEALMVVLTQSQMELDNALTDRDFIRDELSSSRAALQQSVEEVTQLTREIKTLKSKASENSDKIDHLANERDAALAVSAELKNRDNFVKANDQTRETESARLHQALDELKIKCEAYESSIQSSKQISEEMLRCLDSIDGKNDKSLLHSKGMDGNENISTDPWSSQLVPMLQTIFARIGHLANEISEKATSFSKQSDYLSSLTESFQQLERSLVSKETSYSLNAKRMDEEKQCLMADLEKTEIEIKKLNESVHMLTADNLRYQAQIYSIELSGFEVEDLRNENKDLKHLLANANRSVEDARIAAKDIEKQLNEKSLSLEFVLKQLESNENKIRYLSEHQNTDQHLTNEKQRLEQLLKNEVDSRVQFETELRRRMSDEQRALIQEAEQAMRSLREEIEFKTNALKRSEAEAYTAREMKDDLEDQYRRTLDRAIQLESQIAAMENESNRLRRLSDRQQTDHESEIASMQKRFSLVNEEKLENQLLICELKETLVSMEHKLAEANQDLSKTQEQLKVTESNQNSEEKNHLLSYELGRLNREIDILQEHAKENVILQEKLKECEHDNNKLRQKLKAYVERCEKLESSKLTKDKLEAIKKLMADKAAVEKQLNISKQEIESLKSSQSVQASTTLEDTELTKLRFDKDALESKLRKFASQCQRLEDEKLRIIHTLKSAKLELIDENIEKAIVSLCDKVASLEEECDSLAKFKNKAFSNQVELTAMQQQNTELSNKIADLQRKTENLQWIESGHKSLISTLTEGTAKLQYDVDHARQEADSMRNQLKYLEQENLQLMMDYKAAKQKIHGLKAEINQLHSQMSIATATTTSDVGKVSTKKPPKTPCDKENSKGSVNHDSRNKLPPSSSTCKVVQASKSDKIKPIADRLGDAFAAGDENTQECKQS